MGLFSNNHMRCDYEEGPEAPFPTRQIPAYELQCGMTLVSLPEECTQPSVCCGHWPVIIEDPVYREDGEGGVPCIYWTTDEPGDDDSDRSPFYWIDADQLVTIAAEGDW